MSSNSQPQAGKNRADAPSLPNNFEGAKPKDASAPKIDGGKNFTPSTSQSNERGKQGKS